MHTPPGSFYEFFNHSFIRSCFKTRQKLELKPKAFIAIFNFVYIYLLKKKKKRLVASPVYSDEMRRFDFLIPIQFQLKTSMTWQEKQ